jgi:hypothetical protein
MGRIAIRTIHFQYPGRQLSVRVKPGLRDNQSNEVQVSQLRTKVIPGWLYLDETRRGKSRTLWQFAGFAQVLLQMALDGVFGVVGRLHFLRFHPTGTITG